MSSSQRAYSAQQHRYWRNKVLWMCGRSGNIVLDEGALMRLNNSELMRLAAIIETDANGYPKSESEWRKSVGMPVRPEADKWYVRMPAVDRKFGRVTPAP